jgi:U3 small nucleolar RNA-associated protein 4
MDIHRCRFVPLPASSINTLVFSHTLDVGERAPSSLRLALGRSNGDIEIWDPARGTWIQESILRGGKDRSIEGLAWTQELDEEVGSGKTIPGRSRLFSIGYSNAVTEWDLSRGMPLRHSSGNNGDIWCLAAQPRWRKEDGEKKRAEQLLAVGCSDGTVVLHSTADGDLSFVRTLQRSSSRKARVLSLTFCGRDTIIAGCSDSSICVYDIRGHGRVKNTMSLGSGPKKTPIYVWSVKCLSNNILVSGDSTGELKFWDLKTATITQRLMVHDADILTLTPSLDGFTLFSAGMDRKVCLLNRERGSGRWKEVSHQRVHADHVKAMASLECKGMSLVVSGGLFVTLCSNRSTNTLQDSTLCLSLCL